MKFHSGMLRRSNMAQQGSPGIVLEIERNKNDKKHKLSTPKFNCVLVMLRRSMSGSSGLNNLSHSASFVRRNNEREGMGNNVGVSPGGNNAAYRASLVSHYAEDLDRRRRAERAVEEIRTDGSNTHFVC
jgi:hypothetical protein